MGASRRIASALALVAIGMVGCDGDGEGDRGDERGGDAEGVVEVPWLIARPSGGDRTLRIGYESDPCTRARQAAVDEGEREVTVTLLDPQRDPRQGCIQVVKPGCVTVALEEPLAGRRVVDGAKVRFPQAKRGIDRPPFSRFGRCRAIPSR